jgi:hypothetical protein
LILPADCGKERALDLSLFSQGEGDKTTFSGTCSGTWLIFYVSDLTINHSVGYIYSQISLMIQRRAPQNKDCG